MDIIRKVKRYILEKHSIDGGLPQVLEKHFYIELPDLQKEATGEILRVDGALTLRIITASRTDKNEVAASIEREGCFYYRDINERFLEAEFKTFRADKAKDMTIFLRLPLSAPFATGKIGLWFDGTWLRFIKNGYVLNENSGYDLFIPQSDSAFIRQNIQDLKWFEVTKTTIEQEKVKEELNFPYFSPYWWNGNAGDVMNFYHDGVYHLLYLPDRRHHGSRNCCGAHYVAHVTTTDLIHWEEQEDVVSIDAPWITIGTGTMFFSKGKYYMSYGLHTERYTDALQEPKIDPETHTWTRFTYNDAFKNGKFPAGATYAYSDDGINFKQSQVLFHAGRNPSMYVDEDGCLKLYVGYESSGVWKTRDMSERLYKSDENFDFASGSVMRNSTECPSFFEWNGYKYLLVGFTGYFRTLKNDDEFFDAAGVGEQIYDGLCVPMVTGFKNNRKLISGWLNGVGWGSVIVHRELIQGENGKLGMKWVDEMYRELQNGNTFEINSFDELDMQPEKFGYCFDFAVENKNDGIVSLFFVGEKNDGCELQLNLGENRMQFNDCESGNSFGKTIGTMLEKMKKVDKNITYYGHTGETDIPQNSKNYALSDIPYFKENRIRLLCVYVRKLNSTLIDVEINGQRTAISVRPQLKVNKICSKAKSADVCNIKATKLPILNDDLLSKLTK